MSLPDVSLIIVTWNGRALIERCLGSLAAMTGPTCEIIVVDNGSTDGTAEMLAGSAPAARFVALSENLGFAAANNRGLALCSAPLVSLLNNDTTVAPDFLSTLVAAARRHPEFDLFAPEIRSMRAPGMIDNRGIWLDPTRTGRQLDARQPVRSRRPTSEVFGPSGGACLIRRGLLDRLGLFDETLGSYQEDVEFACRARAYGHRTLFVPEAVVLHAGSATGDQFPDRKLYQIQRNLRIVRRRWLSGPPWRPQHVLAPLYDAVQFARAISRHQSAVVRTAWRDAAAATSPWARWATPEACQTLRPWVGVRAKPHGLTDA